MATLNENSLLKEALNKKKPEEKAAAVITEASGQEISPKDASKKNIDAAAAGEAPKNESQRKLYTALAATLPTIIGAAFGGSAGAELGAKETGKFFGNVAEQEAKAKELEKKQQADLEKIQAQNQNKIQEQQTAQQQKSSEKSERDRRDIRDFSQNLRKEYLSNPITKQTQEVAVSYEKVKSAGQNPSAAGDLSLIFGFMKMLDPGSVVREGEFANAQNAAGVPDRVRNAYNNAIRGERLNPDQREDFIGQASNVYKAQLSRQNVINNSYEKLAQSENIDPSNIVIFRETPISETQAPKVQQKPKHVVQRGIVYTLNPETGGYE